MARTYWSAAFLFVAAGLTGCSSGAHFVQKDTVAGTGVVAVPQSSMFQWYYRNAAIDYARDYHDPSGNAVDVIIDSEDEVPVGQQTRTDQKTGKPINGTTTNSTVTSTSALTEYHIKYHVAPRMINGTNMNNPNNPTVLPTGGTSSPNNNRPVTSGIVPVGGIPQSGNTLSPTGQPVVDPRTGQPSQPVPSNNYQNFGGAR